MRTENGFILDVYHYCDRWCEYCAFTARCRVFVDIQAIDFEAAASRSGVETVGGTGGPSDIVALASPANFDVDDAALGRVEKTLDDGMDIAPAYRPIEGRATDYGARVWQWLKTETLPDVHRPDAPEAIEVVEHFGIYIGAKVYRALGGLSRDADDTFRDAQGSCKAALLGIDRSCEAWRDLVGQGRVSAATASTFVADLTWLAGELERLFPRARQFVRPAFDEPEEVARLEAVERAGGI